MKKKTKILFFIQLPPPIHGQSTMNNYIKKSSIINKKYHTRYVNISPAKILSDLGRLSVNKLFTTLLIIVKSTKALLIFKPDITYITLSHIGIAFYKDSILVILAKVFTKSVILLHLHGKGIEAEIRKNKFKRLYYRLIFNRTQVILLADNLKFDINNIYFKNPYILPNGIDKKNIFKEKTFNNKARILFLSNLIKAKGIFVFFDIIEKLKELDLEFEAIVVGQHVNIPNEEIQSVIAKKRIDSYTTFLNAKYGIEKDEILFKADIIVFPSFTEAFPLVLLEAMKFGVCVVANSVGGIPNMIDNHVNGYLVNDNNIEEYVKIITSLISDKNQRKKISTNAQIKFIKQYTIEKFEKKIVEIFKDVIATKKL